MTMNELVVFLVVNFPQYLILFIGIGVLLYIIRDNVKRIDTLETKLDELHQEKSDTKETE